MAVHSPFATMCPSNPPFGFLRSILWRISLFCWCKRTGRVPCSVLTPCVLGAAYLSFSFPRDHTFSFPAVFFCSSWLRFSRSCFCPGAQRRSLRSVRGFFFFLFLRGLPVWVSPSPFSSFSPLPFHLTVFCAVLYWFFPSLFHRSAPWRLLCYPPLLFATLAWAPWVRSSVSPSI